MTPLAEGNLFDVAWDCNVRCFVCCASADELDATATRMPAHEQPYESELALLVEDSLVAARADARTDFPSADDILERFTRLPGLLEHIGDESGALVAAIRNSQEHQLISEVVAQGLEEFVAYWGSEHSTNGTRSAETFELFDLTATIYVMCARLEEFGRAAGLLAFLWDVAICSHFRLFSNTRETQTQLLVQRREIELVLAAADAGDDIDASIIRLRRHLFARARLSAIRGCAQ